MADFSGIRFEDHLITGSGPLLDSAGRLREPGYAFLPPFEYNREAIGAPTWRIKDWDYYLVNDDDYALCLTFGDLGYMGLVSASLIEFAAGRFTTTSEMIPLPLGKMNLPRSSSAGAIHWKNLRASVDWTTTSAGRRLSFSMRRFKGTADLEAELWLDQAPRDSMVIATPWAEDDTAFYYNRKVIGMRAQGGFRVGALFHEFEAEKALGLLDWGRGVWTYDNTWYWAAAQGRQGGHVVGMNLGYGFGDTSRASENMVFVDGVAHKLGLVDFGIPVGTDGTYRYLDPWHVTDDKGRLDLAFATDIDRTDHVDLGNLIVSEQHQVFGRFSGTIVLDDGSKLEVRELRGSAEHIHNQY